jgi:diacylglycerol kinase family enzyme
MDKIGIIFNPFAGKNKRDPAGKRARLEKILGNQGILRETRSLAELDEAAKEFHDKRVEVLAISGGDGTNQNVLTAFRKIYSDTELPILGLLRGGTMNLLECSLGLRGNPESRLKKLLQVVASGKYPVISHTLLCVNGRFGYIFGNGVIANFLREYYHTGKPNFRQAMLTFARAFWAAVTGNSDKEKLFARVQAYVRVDGSLLPETSFFALMAATEKECGLGFKPFYRAREEQGKFHFLALNMGPAEVVQNLARFRAGKKVNSSSCFEAVTNSVSIETFDHYYYTIDGEMLNSTKQINISAGPVVKIMAI